jgi:hypothetical protein
MEHVAINPFHQTDIDNPAVKDQEEDDQEPQTKPSVPEPYKQDEGPSEPVVPPTPAPRPVISTATPVSKTTLV